MNSLAQTAREPYYPGFRDLNLYVVAVFLVVFLYLIAIAATAYRVRAAKSRLAEITILLQSNLGETQEARLKQDREQAQRDYDVLTASGPGRWFR